MKSDTIEPLQVFSSYGMPPAERQSDGPRNPFPGVVTLIVESDRIVLVQRRPKAFQGGKWCLPGGFIEYNEDFLTAGRREVREETGLAVSIESVLSVVSNFFSPRLHTVVVVLLGRVDRDSPPPKAGDDAVAMEWFDLAGPLPEMAFEADRHIIERYHATRLAGAPVDRRFAIG